MPNLQNNNYYPDRIAEFFENKTILLSGGTGFVGKVFIEKLLRSCPKVGKLFVFIRTKKDKNPQERLKEIFNGPLFDLLREERGSDIFQKVEAIPANFESADLDLSKDDRDKLCEEVEVIFHCAATIRFDEELQKAVFLNVRGTKLLLELAKDCRKLMLFSHLSTSYCHLDERILYEKAYPPPASPHHVLKACEWLDNEMLNKITRQILGKIPNTYAFTKALGEALVNDEMDNLPVIILRPSVIIPIWKEPIPGWTDNINGPMGLLIGAGKGVIRTMYCNGSTYSDYMPVDIVANCMLTTAFFYFQSNQRIFNITSSAQYKVSFEEVIAIGRRAVEEEVPFNMVMWYPGGSMKTSRLHHYFDFVMFQLIPALILDRFLVVLGYKPILLRVQKRVLKGYDVFEYYANNQWDFNNEKLLKGVESLNIRERQIYKLDGDGIDYYDYFKKCVLASRRYILNEPDETIPAAKMHMQIMWALDRMCKLLFFVGIAYLLYNHFFK